MFAMDYFSQCFGHFLMSWFCKGGRFVRHALFLKLSAVVVAVIEDLDLETGFDLLQSLCIC